MIYHCLFIKSKSLHGDRSLLFSPPSIIKETLAEEVLGEVLGLPKAQNSIVGISVSYIFLHYQILEGGRRKKMLMSYSQKVIILYWIVR